MLGLIAMPRCTSVFAQRNASLKSSCLSFVLLRHEGLG